MILGPNETLQEALQRVQTHPAQNTTYVVDAATQERCVFCGKFVEDGTRVCAGCNHEKRFKPPWYIRFLKRCLR